MAIPFTRSSSQKVDVRVKHCQLLDKMYHADAHSGIASDTFLRVDALDKYLILPVGLGQDRMRCRSDETRD